MNNLQTVRIIMDLHINIAKTLIMVQLQGLLNSKF